MNKVAEFLSGGFRWLRAWWNRDTIEYMNEYYKKQDDKLFGMYEMIGKLIDDNKDIHKELRMLKVSHLKSNVFNKSLPLKERVIAGEIYVEELGENGETKAEYLMLAEKLKKQLEKAEDTKE